MTNRTDTPIQRATAFALAAVMTLAVLGGIDTLAHNDLAADALLAQQVSAHRA
jgi:DNA-binding sugar fermentation-stimulating protein